MLQNCILDSLNFSPYFNSGSKVLEISDPPDPGEIPVSVQEFGLQMLQTGQESEQIENIDQWLAKAAEANCIPIFQPETMSTTSLPHIYESASGHDTLFHQHFEEHLDMESEGSEVELNLEWEEMPDPRLRDPISISDEDTAKYSSKSKSKGFKKLVKKKETKKKQKASKKKETKKKKPNKTKTSKQNKKKKLPVELPLKVLPPRKCTQKQKEKPTEPEWKFNVNGTIMSKTEFMQIPKENRYVVEKVSNPKIVRELLKFETYWKFYPDDHPQKVNDELLENLLNFSNGVQAVEEYFESKRDATGKLPVETRRLEKQWYATKHRVLEMTQFDSEDESIERPKAASQTGTSSKTVTSKCFQTEGNEDCESSNIQCDVDDGYDTFDQDSVNKSPTVLNEKEPMNRLSLYSSTLTPNELNPTKIARINLSNPKSFVPVRPSPMYTHSLTASTMPNEFARTPYYETSLLLSYRNNDPCSSYYDAFGSPNQIQYPYASSFGWRPAPTTTMGLLPATSYSSNAVQVKDLDMRNESSPVDRDPRLHSTQSNEYIQHLSTDNRVSRQMLHNVYGHSPDIPFIRRFPTATRTRPLTPEPNTQINDGIEMATQRRPFPFYQNLHINHSPVMETQTRNWWNEQDLHVKPLPPIAIYSKRIDNVRQMPRYQEPRAASRFNPRNPSPIHQRPYQTRPRPNEHYSQDSWPRSWRTPHCNYYSRNRRSPEAKKRKLQQQKYIQQINIDEMPPERQLDYYGGKLKKWLNRKKKAIEKKVEETKQNCEKQ